MEKLRDLKWYQNRVKILYSKPQEPQRSIGWFKARNTRITASEAACCLTLSESHCKEYVETYNVPKFKYNPNKCLSHYDNREDYIINKCRTFYGENLFKDSIYTLHGKKYEEIATRLYRIEYNTDVIEFGLLSHPRVNWLGASPDGITSNGIMLEIKCPYSRKIIEGIPPIWYECQMQIQLEVCDLNQCDFLECEIKELSSELEFINQQIIGKQSKGILLNKLNEPDNSECKYIYPPDCLNTTVDFINWSNSIIEENKLENIIVIPIYYFINKWHVLNVFRRKQWYDSVKHNFKETMDIIKRLQNNKELFDDYKHSIYLLRNKEYIEKYNNTVCLINTQCDDDEEFIIEQDTSISYDMEIDEMNNNVCLINDSEC